MHHFWSRARIILAVGASQSSARDRTSETSRLVAHARNLSIAMTLVGLLLVGAAFAADLSPIVTLTGMLLFVAGIVKIAMIAIWKSFFSIPVEAPAQSNGTPPASDQK